MPTPAISEKLAREIIETFEECLQEGFKRHGFPSALQETGRRLIPPKKIDNATMRRIKELHDLEPDLSLYLSEEDRAAEKLCQDTDPSEPLRAGEKITEDGRRVPLSEDERKFQKGWSAKRCVAHLREIAEDSPNKVITRNFFRINSEISESTWNRYFGTFHEYKRAANIVLSRHAHRLEKSIAKHSSKDVQRQMNIDKAGYEDKYAKPAGTRFQTILTGSDLHDKLCDPFYRRLFIEAARRIQPDVIVLDGDVFDLTEFSRFTKDPRDWDPVGRINWVHEFLAELREVCPDTQIDLIEGNHEYRLLRHLSESTPALKQILSDLHGFTVASLLGLDAYEVNFIAKADLTAFTERDIKDELRRNWKVYFDAVLAHHYPSGRQMGFPGWNGHHHKHVVTPFYSPTFGSSEWHQIGCGHRREATFCDGAIWANGFLIAYVDTQAKHTAFEYVEIRDHAVIGGRWYERRDDERLWEGAA